MTEETRLIIEELKKVVLDLHRSAGYLDSIIESFERDDMPNDSEYFWLFVVSQHRYLNDLRTNKGCVNLDKKESDLFDKLIESIKHKKQ